MKVPAPLSGGVGTWSRPPVTNATLLLEQALKSLSLGWNLLSHYELSSPGPRFPQWSREGTACLIPGSLPAPVCPLHPSGPCLCPRARAWPLPGPAASPPLPAPSLEPHPGLCSLWREMVLLGSPGNQPWGEEGFLLCSCFQPRHAHRELWVADGSRQVV